MLASHFRKESSIMPIDPLMENVEYLFILQCMKNMSIVEIHTIYKYQFKTFHILT